MADREGEKRGKMEIQKIEYLENKKSFLGNVKFISCLALHGKKFNARCAKIILFSFKESRYTKRNFLFILSDCHGNAFL